VHTADIVTSKLRPGSTDLALGILFLLVSVIAPFLEESHRRFWTFAPLVFAVPLLCSATLLLLIQRRAAIVAARLIHYLLLVVCVHLILVSALWLLNPFMWGAALLMPWPTLLVAANSLGTLQWTAQTKGERIRGCLVPVVASIVALPTILAGFLIWHAAGSVHAHRLYEKSGLAAQMRAGRWQLVMTDPTTRALHRWQDDHYRSEEFRCLRFDGDHALTFVTVDSLVRLSPTDGRNDSGRLPPAPIQGCCPSMSRDRTLIVWREGGKKPFVVLARQEKEARTELARWAIGRLRLPHARRTQDSHL
jgi:hypothetical protein